MLKYLLTKKDIKKQLIRCILLLQKCDLVETKNIENVIADRLSCLTFDNDKLFIMDSFIDKQLFSIKITLWYDDIVNFLVANELP